MSGQYVCSLDDASLKKAQTELNEIPSDRIAAVQALRNWVKEQPHINAPDFDDSDYLVFLRGAKFSQLRAREMIEGNMAMRSASPQWFSDIDTRDPKLQPLLEDGYMFSLPNRTKDGCQVLFQRVGCIDADLKRYGIAEILRTALITGQYLSSSERTQVNGSVFIADLTGFTAKHLVTLNNSDIKKFKQLWIKNAPGRYKQFHYYNAGAFFDTIIAIAKPFMPKKFMDRIKTHDNLESLYKYVPKELLPDEYLPDDYNGPSAGPVRQLVENFKKEIETDAFRNKLLYITQRQWGVDENKRLNKDCTLQQSFRKLNLD